MPPRSTTDLAQAVSADLELIFGRPTWPPQPPRRPAARPAPATTVAADPPPRAAMTFVIAAGLVAGLLLGGGASADSLRRPVLAAATFALQHGAARMPTAAQAGLRPAL